MMSAKPEQKKHMWVIGGPAGSGKTTVGQYLAVNLSLPYVEGDDVSVHWTWIPTWLTVS
jgi:cytidylate kinase